MKIVDCLEGAAAEVWLSRFVWINSLLSMSYEGYTSRNPGFESETTPSILDVTLKNDFPVVAPNADGDLVYNYLPKSAMSLIGLATFMVLCFGIAKAVEWCYDRLSLRDADSEMSERTKQLLLSRISTFAFAKKLKLDGMDTKKRNEELSKKYIEKWRFRVAMTKRMKRRIELAEKEEERRKKQTQGPLGFLRRLSIFNRKKDADKEPEKEVPPPMTTPQKRPSTACSGTQTRRSALRRSSPSRPVSPDKPIPASPTKSSLKQPGSAPNSPTKSPKRVTLVTYKEAESPRQAKDDDFLAIEMTHTKSANKAGSNHSKLHRSGVCANDSSPVKVSTDETPTTKDKLEVEDTCNNVSLDEFDFTESRETSTISTDNKQNNDTTVVDITNPTAKRSEEVSVNMEKYIRPPTRDNARAVSRPITAGGAKSSRKQPARPSTAVIQRPAPHQRPPARRATKS